MDIALIILAYSIAGGIPVISLVLLQHYAEYRARKVFTPEQYRSWLNNEE